MLPKMGLELGQGAARAPCMGSDQSLRESAGSRQVPGAEGCSRGWRCAEVSEPH